MDELVIWMSGEQVGVLDGSDRRSLRVVYADEWMARSQSTPLSVSLPLGARTHAGHVVAAYLWGLLPDNERVLARWAATFQCSATDVFGLLKGVGADVAGAAQFLPPGVSSEESAYGEVEPLTDDDVAELLRGLRSDAAAWHPGARGRWSLAGAQAKLALSYDDRNGTWGIPSGVNPTTHILKPAIAGFDHHDLNEHLCLASAGVLGLRTAETRIRRFAGEPALVVTRYDRIVRDGSLVRVHQEDCCQALGVHPDRKYEADGGPSVDDIARLLHDVELRSAVADVDALLRAAAFNWLILGTDAHAKNYSLLLSGRQVRLAPLYDIASAAVYGDHPMKLRMAQKIGGEYRPAFIAARHWERLAKAARVDPERLHSDIVEMAAQLPRAFAETIDSTDLERAERTAAQKLLDAVSEWIVTCRRAMGAG